MTEFATGGLVPGGGAVITAGPCEFVVSARWLGTCPCGHPWLRHDVDEYRGDGSEMCCVEGCEQTGCPGRSTNGVTEGVENAPDQ